MNKEKPALQPYEYEPAAYSYLMSLAAAVAGLPLPILNLIASLIYFLAKRRSSYAVRWHSLQALLAQCVIMPFNSIALVWTIGVISYYSALNGDNMHGIIFFSKHMIAHPSVLYWCYLSFVVLLNIFEFIAMIATAIQVRKGINIRWFVIASLTDTLCSRKNRDPYATI